MSFSAWQSSAQACQQQEAYTTQRPSWHLKAGVLSPLGALDGVISLVSQQVSHDLTIVPDIELKAGIFLRYLGFIPLIGRPLFLLVSFVSFSP